MLLGADEYPFHQVATTFAGVASGDPSWNDGHYLCAADQAGAVALTSNLRLYPNNDVMDGFVCVRHDGLQYNVRVSRRLRPAVDHLRVGPLAVEIAEPLQTVRMTLDESANGVALDLTFHTANVPYIGPAEIRRVDGRLISERVTYEITGTCAGWVDVAGTRIHLDAATTSMFRNHSWGFGPGRGGPRPYGAPTPPKRAPGLRQWVLFHQPDHGGFFFADPSGRAAAGRAAILTDEGAVPATVEAAEVEMYDGGRRLRRGSFRLAAAGVARDYQFEDLGWVYCQGGGYFGGFDDGLGQGVYRGEYHAEGEVWDVSHPTTVVDVTSGRAFQFEHDWAESFVRVTQSGRTGMAHYEAVVVR